MSKILITGSLGLVGSACVELFTEKGWTVIGIDSNQRSHFFGTPSKHGSLPVDIRDRQFVDDLFAAHHFDAVIHAAAQPSHGYSDTHVMEDFEINTVGTLNLLEASRKYCPNATFVYVSTDKVYGENLPSDKLASEKDGLDFAGQRSPFGCSKAAADMYVQEYGNSFGMKTVCFRPGCITGKNHEGAEQHGFLAYVAKCVREGKPYTIFADTIRDQIHANDLASAFWHYIELPFEGSQVYNIGGGLERAVSVSQALELCEKQLKKKTEILQGTMRPGDRVYDVHDVTKFRTDYPEWDYTYSLSDIIKDVCEKI